MLGKKAEVLIVAQDGVPGFSGRAALQDHPTMQFSLQTWAQPTNVMEKVTSDGWFPAESTPVVPHACRLFHFSVEEVIVLSVL